MTDTLATDLIEELRAATSGEVVTPRDEAYDEARALYFTGLDRRPAAIVRPRSAEEVAAAVSLARHGDVEMSVRGGGHAPAGHSVPNGAVVLDLRALRTLEIDATDRRARAGAGLTAGAYTEEVGAHGLATGFGDSPSVGLAGITLGGGVGYLHRKLGLTIDSLLGAQIVTADGEVREVDADTHSDLFWAIRGGGGNFGVVTRLDFRLHEVRDVQAGSLVLPATPELVVRFFAAMQAAPDALSSIVNLMIAPPMPFLPPEVHGRFVLMAIVLHAGGGAAAERALAPLRALATPVLDDVAPMRYAEVFAHAAPPPARLATIRSGFVDGMERETAEAAFDHLQRGTAPMRVVQVRMLGGAVRRVSSEDTAFAHRARGAMLNVGAMYERSDEAAEHEAWAGAASRDLHGERAGAYVGFMGDEGEARVREAYPDPFWARLSRIKARYDPSNLFRYNQNIPPE